MTFFLLLLLSCFEREDEDLAAVSAASASFENHNLPVTINKLAWQSSKERRTTLKKNGREASALEERMDGAKTIRFFLVA